MVDVKLDAANKRLTFALRGELPLMGGFDEASDQPSAEKPARKRKAPAEGTAKRTSKRKPKED